MFVRPPLPDFLSSVRSTIPLYGMGANQKFLNREKFHYQLPIAMQQWAWAAQDRAMQREEDVRFYEGFDRRDQPPAPARMGPPNPGLDRLVKAMANMPRPAPRPLPPPPSVVTGGMPRLPRMPMPLRG